ncbi:hypothetical protein QBC99_005253 [Beijerinckia sp. GAS462]|nr:hypothetical protein [Beijerinckia sp. GAS462]SED93663.1 hypothetical protein SAMN05443249_5972 [Beijerinckia sp. 28-YEA-48]
MILAEFFRGMQAMLPERPADIVDSLHPLIDKTLN